MSNLEDLIDIEDLDYVKCPRHLSRMEYDPNYDGTTFWCDDCGNYWPDEDLYKILISKKPTAKKKLRKSKYETLLGWKHRAIKYRNLYISAFATNKRWKKKYDNWCYRIEKKYWDYNIQRVAIINFLVKVHPEIWEEFVNASAEIRNRKD